MSEGIFFEYIQLIAFILIENGHDIYNPERLKFVKSYEELDKVSLFIKLKFVEEHGFEFIADTIDRKIRNCIAHLRYVVKEDGTIINKINGEKTEGLEQKTLIMVRMSRIILSCFQEALL